MTAPSREAPTVLEKAKTDVTPLAVLFCAAFFGLGFVFVAYAVFGGSTAGFDRDVLLALRASDNVADPIGPRWVEEAARDLTALGSNSVLGIAVLAAVLYLFLAGRSNAALLLMAAIAGGVFLVAALKIGFARPRPDIVPPLARTFTTSFPSSHAAVSAAVYLTLGALFARIAAARVVKMYVVALAVGLTLIVGASRVYLGLHYPTDVLAGWCIGAAWAMLCWAVALYLQKRGKIGPNSVRLE